jgi:hypothetical protein
MADIFIPPQRIETPSSLVVNTGRLTFATPVAAKVDAVNHLQGFRFLRCVTRIQEYVPAVTLERPTEVIKLRWTTSALARFIWVGFNYYAMKGSGDDPTVNVSLESPDGLTVYDEGVQFIGSESTLRLNEGISGITQELGQLRDDFDYAHTGFAQRPEETTQTPVARLLNINDGGGANTDVVCKLDVTNVLVVSVTVWEAYREAIGQ